MRIHVEPGRSGPDYMPAVKVVVESRNGVEPWEPQVAVTLPLDAARALFGQLGQAIKTIEANADPS